MGSECMKEKLKYYYSIMKSSFKFSKFYCNKKNMDGLSAELIRYTHSMEKGLSISKIKLGFGHQKQKEMITIIKKLEKSESNYYDEIISMAISSLNEYIDFHESNNYQDEFIKYLKEFVNQRKGYIKEDFGGTIDFNCDELDLNVKDIEKLFYSRHSIRNFTDKPVDNEIIKKAIKLAQRCPSACNRQGVRVYVVDNSKYDGIIKQLSGIGGFADGLDKLVIVTGKLSSYRYDEVNQYIVSASIFAGYLSLTLHLYGLGACIIQRSVIWNKNTEFIKREFNIDDDEQVVCMLGVGNVGGNIKVPVSHRLNIDEFAKFIK